MASRPRGAGGLGWEAPDLYADRAERDRLAAANLSLQETIDDMAVEAVANAAALAAEARIAALEESLKRVDAAQDCKPDPALQPLVDGLR